jgi:hypothetical protein
LLEMLGEVLVHALEDALKVGLVEPCRRPKAYRRPRAGERGSITVDVLAPGRGV